MNTTDRDSNWEADWASYNETRVIARKIAGPREEVAKAQGVSVTVAMSQGGDPLVAKLLDSVKKPFLAAQAVGGDFHTVSVVNEERRETFQEGDVLQLSTEFERDCGRRLFVYVISAVSSQVEVALFSPLSLPASREELTTELGMKGLEVLQLWNKRSLSSWLLARSWRVKEVDDSLKEDVHLMLKLGEEGGEVPDSLAKRQGGAVVSPLDVRWNYFQEEGELLADIEPAS